MRGLFGGGKRSERADDGWAALTALVSGPARADAQLGALLHGLTELLGVQVIHLYYSDEDGARYAFIQRAGPGLPQEARPPDPSAPLVADAGPVPVLGAAAAGQAATEEAGAEVLLHLPPATLMPNDVRHGELVNRRSSRLLSWLLSQNGQPVALVELGPPADERQLRELTATLTAWSPALAFLLERLRREIDREEALRRLQANVEVRERVVKAMVDPLAFMQMLLQVAVVATRSHGGFVAAADPDGTMALVAELGLPEPFRQELNLDPQQGIFDADPDLGIVLVRDDAFLSRTGTSSLLALPLIEEGEWEGVVALAQFGRRAEPSEYSLDVLRVLADQISLVLRNRRVYATFTQRYLGALKSLAQALDASGRQGTGHHAWVADVAEALGRTYGADAETIARARAAAEIHDVGLCAIAADADTVTEKEHPVLGAALLEVLPEMGDVARAVRAQHEWHNGWGFPDGLRGEQIPLEGRLLALAEFAADLRSASPDPAAPPFHERFFTMLQQRSGTQFDPALVEAALRLDPAVLRD